MPARAARNFRQVSFVWRHWAAAIRRSVRPAPAATPASAAAPSPRRSAASSSAVTHAGVAYGLCRSTTRAVSAAGPAAITGWKTSRLSGRSRFWPTGRGGAADQLSRPHQAIPRKAGFPIVGRAITSASAGRTRRGDPPRPTGRPGSLEGALRKEEDASKMGLWNSRWLGVPYSPRSGGAAFLERAEVRKDDELVVRAAVLENRESERFFGVPLARRGIQPVWLEITNNGDAALPPAPRQPRPQLLSAPGGGVRQSFRIGRRLLGFGLLAWLFLPLLILLPFKVLAARIGQPADERLFPGTRHRLGPDPAGHTSWRALSSRPSTRARNNSPSGCWARPASRTSRFDSGARPQGRSRRQTLRRTRTRGGGGRVRRGRTPQAARRRCRAARRTGSGTVEGDPLNLVVVGDFDTILNGFGAAGTRRRRSACGSCWRTFKAFSLGSRYRYSPVSPLYVDGPQPGLRPAEGAADDQRAAAPAAVDDAAAVPGQAGLDRPDQPGHRRALHAEDLEPDHAQDRSRCR